jgi:hypothetical protein
MLIVAVTVVGRDGQPLATAELTEISPRGARLEMALALAVGETVRLAFQARREPPLQLTGQIRWRADAARGFVYGLTFTDINPDVRQQLLGLLGPWPADPPRVTSPSGGR